MSDRRNSAPVQRQGQRPAGQGQRRPNNSRKAAKKKANNRFFIFLAVSALLAVGIGIAVGMRGGNNDGTVNEPGNVNQPTAAPQNNVSTQNQGNVLTDDAGETDELHAPQLSTDYQVKVDDLHINPDLDDQWLNVLLLGSDQRVPNEPFRTDTMMICSINKSTGEVKLTSLMRDTAMPMDELGDQSGYYRCNVACYVGGPEYLIRYYVMVDFTSFSIIADNLGGIDIAVSKAEMDEINHNLRRQARVAYDSGMSEEQVYATHTYLEEYGENVHLNGPQVLAYARIRKLDSDSARTERQRKVLTAMLDKLRQKSPQDVITLAMSLGNYISTNMTIDDIISVAIVVVGSDMQVGQMRIPENGTYVLETRDGESMLYDTDWEANGRAVRKFIYGE